MHYTLNCKTMSYKEASLVNLVAGKSVQYLKRLKVFMVLGFFSIIPVMRA